MPSIVIGTAGHVDHGKTSLIRALTGVDCDRLAEEKRRGITIELGFTRWQLPSGRAVGVVDVPGHEAFVKTMVSGATGVHLVLLVVAADEGVMPQTREHLVICRQLGVSRAVVALTKRDLVDAETAALAREEVAEVLDELGYAADTPMVEVSVAGEAPAGLAELGRTVEAAIAGWTPARAAADLFRLPVDRAFVIQGFGTVVTGTTHAGTVAIGEELEVLPGRRRARVRGIEVHGEKVERAAGGQRTALNLSGLGRARVTRGDLLAHPGQLRSTRRCDATVELLPDLDGPLPDGATVSLHAGTRRVGAGIRAVEGALVAGERYVRLELRSPLALVYGDRFVLRGSVPLRDHGLTIGGGRVLDPAPPAWRALSRADRLARLGRLAAGEPRTALVEYVQAAGIAGLTRGVLAARLGLSAGALGELLPAVADQVVPLGGDVVLAPAALDQVAERLRDQVLAWEEPEPPSLAAVASRLPRRIPEAALPVAVGLAVERGWLDQAGDRLAPPGAAGPGELSALERRVLDCYLTAALTPPRDAELAGAVGAPAPEVVAAQRRLHQVGELVRVKDQLSFAAAPLDEFQKRVVAHLAAHGEIAAQEAKALAGVSRKFLIPLMEYLDRQRVTLRVGDKRVLRKKRG